MHDPSVKSTKVSDKMPIVRRLERLLADNVYVVQAFCLVSLVSILLLDLERGATYLNLE